MTKFAISIGNSDYRDERITKLKCAVNDARAMSDLLQRKLGFHAILRTNATVPEVLSSIEDIGRQVQPEDSVLFYFAGHAAASEGQQFLLGTEARSDLLSAGITAGAPGLISVAAIDKLTEPFARCHRLLVLDGCGSASLEAGTRSVRIGTGMSRAEPLIFRDLLLRRRVSTVAYPLSVLTACEPGQRAAELPDLGHGAFTLCLMEVLQEAARNHTPAYADQALVVEINRRIKACTPGQAGIGTAGVVGPASPRFAIYEPKGSASAK
jgi:uncharacterized caspase-like protein